MKGATTSMAAPPPRLVRRIIQLAAAVGRFATPPVRGRAPLALVEAGEARASIIVPAAAAATETCSASDLRNVLKSMTGAELPLVTDAEEVRGNRVLIGATRFTDAVVAPGERSTIEREGYIARTRSFPASDAGPPHVDLAIVAGVARRPGRIRRRVRRGRDIRSSRREILSSGTARKRPAASRGRDAGAIRRAPRAVLHHP